MTTKTFTIAFILVISLAFSIAGSSAQFTNINAGLPAVYSGTVACGDLDNDGYLDILLTGNGIAQIWHNQGNGTFTNINAGLPGVYYSSVALADFDNDGYLDILLNGINTNNVCISQIWHNLGNGTFTNINLGLPGTAYGSVICGDFNNDGKIDFLLAGKNANNSNFCQLWLNLGNNKFTNVNIGLIPSYFAIGSGDFFGDGNLDFLLAGEDTNYLPVFQIWHNLGNSYFTNSPLPTPIYAAYVRAVGVNGQTVACTDFDNDGKLDLVIRGPTNLFNYPIQSQVWRNLGNGLFTNIINNGLPAGSGYGAGSVVCGDYDNDGYPDILLAGMGSNALIDQVWRNLGNGTFTNINASLPGVTDCSLAWGDFNNDGLIDILVTGSTSGNAISTVWQNFSPITNAPPTAPSNLNSVVTGKGVTLSWSAASDAQTPAGGLSYNVRVGTTPGGCDILSPMADPVTGFRRVAQLGNAQERLFAYLTNLTIGTTYYWSVQAVDTAWAGGPFATESNFTIIPFPPFVTTLAASKVTNNSAALAAQASPNVSPAALWFQYGPTTNYGSITSVTNIGSGTNTVTVTNLITGLSGGVAYHCQAVASNSLGTTYGNDVTFYTSPFVKITAATGAFNGCVMWGDFDNDGNLDLLLSGFGVGAGPIDQIWRNLGNGTFTNISAGLPGEYQSTVAWGDFNNDGFLDLLTPAQVFQNMGNGSFTNINVGLPGGNQSTVAWVDYDNDGLPDIFIGATTSQIWRNLGNGTFTNINVGLPGQYYSSAAAWGDYNNDGFMDVVLGDYAFVLWRNLGNGSFTNIPAREPPLSAFGSVAWGDYDNDGYLDMLITGNDYSPTTQIWRNLGNGTFTNINVGLPGVVYGCAVWGDYDNDGYLDILLTGSTNSSTTGGITQIWRNVGNGTFTNINAGLPGVSYSSASWGDYDNDGKLDLILTGSTNGPNGNGICQLWHNFTPISNTPPTAPTNLSATVYGTGVVLNWGAATDAQTPSTGLYYNVRVGTTPGGFDVMSPMADPATGFRRVPQLGNAQERLFSYLTNLTIGTTYYWSVQAIDTAWAGGPFATEASFTITLPAPPVILHPAYASGSGNFGFDITGTSGFQVTVQTSSNLVNWMPIWTSTFGSIPVHFTDSQAGANSNRFYRVVIP